MKKFAIGFSKITVLLAFIFLGSNNIYGQEESESTKDTRPIRNTFESVLLIDNQTVMVPYKGTLEMDIQHRFGLLGNGFDDLFGIYAPSEIRLGFNYVPVDKLQVGFGLTSERLLWDFHVKYAILKQHRSGGLPISLTYLGNMAIDTRDGDNFLETVDRFAYFNQLMLARKFSDKLSLQASANVTHWNAPEEYYDSEQSFVERLNATHLSLSFLGRFKLNDAIALIVDYDMPLTDHDVMFLEPEANLSFGLEFVTSAHAFQLFVGNYQKILPHLNNTTNQNKFGDGDFALGFNMTRLWSY